MHASHPAAPSLNLGPANFSLLLSSQAVERVNPSSANARDLANAVTREGLTYVSTA